MKVAVIQSNYLPWKGYFDIIHDVDLFCFYDEVKYTKNDWRNRNRICSANGPFWITVPIHKDAVKQKISEVKILDKTWQQEHYESIYQSYRKAPFFHQLEPLLIEFYLAKEWELLSEFNQFSIQYIANYFGITTKFMNSKDYDLRGDRIERLLNLLKELNATTYISGPSAKVYLAEYENLFVANNITLIYKDYSYYPEYSQMIEPFQQYVSILDLIANVSSEDITESIWGWRNK